LLYNYDLPLIKQQVSKEALAKRQDSFWKFRELLPLKASNQISLGEPYTPILEASFEYNGEVYDVSVKDDGRLPTGTFKSRGMAVAVSKLKELGVKRVAVPSAGNAAAALAAYGAKARMDVYAFMPRDVPEVILKECIRLGAQVYLVDGLISVAGKFVKQLAGDYGWFDVSTNKQPYRFEGYKAIAFELAEQYEWKLPDHILFPTGGGEGVIGIWKGIRELMQLGWIQKAPRITIVQSSGCAPFVEAFVRGRSEIKTSWKKAETIAAGLRVPFPFASYLVLKAVRETGGTAVAVEEKEIVSSMKAFLREGIYAGPEAASTLAAFRELVKNKVLDKKEKTLLYITGTALKHFDSFRVDKSQVHVLNEDTRALRLDREKSERTC
jgi:threonine synthase